MQPIPQPITDVSVYPYYPGIPIPVKPVLTGASGTYSVGTLITSAFYNMDLHGGKAEGTFRKGGTYYALATDASGKQFEAHWMYCTETGASPEFGLTRNLSQSNVTAPAPSLAEESKYIKLEALEDFTNLHTLTPPAIGTFELTLGKTGWLISTRVGTPHRMGFLIEKPDIPSWITVGGYSVSVSAKTASDGKEVGYDHLTLVEADATQAVFLRGLFK